ncbi:MAG: STAS domain-containing protein [Spirochaetota bacterium]
MNKIIIKENSKIVEIEIKGDLNIHNIDSVLNDYKHLLTKNPVIIGINCENLKSVDSSGLGALISMAKLAEKDNIDFYVCELNKKVSTLFDISNLNRYFQIISLNEFKTRCETGLS